MFRKYVFIFRCFFLVLLVNLNTINAQKNNYEIIDLDNSLYYYNAIIFKGDVYFGTDQGVYKKDENEIILFDNTIVGPITINKNQITPGFIRSSEMFKTLLPKNLQNNATNELVFDDNLLIITEGKLFVYKEYNLKKSNIGSVRAISKNYIGTYSKLGVINKNDTTKILRYTTSYIREFPNATFICWDGLYVKNDSIVKNYFSELFPGVKIGDKTIGNAKDVIEIKHPKYLLNTDKGFYFLDIETDSVELISNEFSEVSFVNPSEPFESLNGENDFEIVLFAFKKDIYALNVNSKEIKQMYNFKKNINGVLSFGTNEFYILFDDSLVRFNASSKTIEILIDGLRLVNDVGLFQNFVFVTTDLGLSIYDKNSQVGVKNIFNDELNKKAYYVKKDSLILGGTNGLYSISYPALTNLFLNKIKINNPKPLSVTDQLIKYKWHLIGLFSLLLFISNVILYKKFREAKKMSFVDVSSLKNEIESYIDQNLSTVNIEILKSEFSLTNKQLYDYMGNENPGEIIRKKRVSLVKKLRNNRKSEDEISKLTGFSVSYLKKI